MHWGLIPFWAKGFQPKYSTINSTIEKLTQAATWRGPWSRGRRCILPATGFYEWKVQADGKTKQPYYITANDQAIFGFAGLWDRSKRDDGTTIESCTFVTMPASKLMSEIHNAKQRMPAIVFILLFTVFDGAGDCRRTLAAIDKVRAEGLLRIRNAWVPVRIQVAAPFIL